MSRRTAPFILLAVVLTLALAGSAPAREAIRGPNYRTSAPTGWHIDKRNGGGWNTVTITPPSHVSNGRDTALVSIAVAPVSRIKRLSGGVKASDKAGLVKRLISIPRNSANLNVARPPSPTRFAGKPAMTYSVNYTFTGHGTVHTATLVRRGKRMYMIQVITDEDVTLLGGSAVDTIRDSWRWK
jgi:hypothetical protein